MGRLRIVSWAGVMAGLSVVMGALAAVLWARVVRLPAYVVQADNTAVMSEHGHTEVFASDAWFGAIGLVAGLILGALAWSWFRSLGWPAALFSVGSGLVAGLVCWGFGQLLGPGDFATRLAHAAPGESVPIAFQLHAPAALAVWGMAAVLPSLLASALGPELPEPTAGAGPRGRVDEASLPEGSAALERQGT